MEVSGFFAKFVDKPFSTLAFTSEDEGDTRLDAPLSTKRENKTNQPPCSTIRTPMQYVYV